jgi:hypothetical protein
MAQATCVQCGDGFEPRRRDQSYCSKVCKERARGQRQREAAATLSCSVEGCQTRPVAGLRAGLCSTHYRRLRRRGDVGSPELERGGRFGITPCSVVGCTRTYYAKDLCRLHYNRQRTTGDPGAVSTTKRPNGEGTIAIVNGYRRLQWYVNGKRIAVAEHRQVMEQTLGRPLEPFENVHHKNGRRADNRPDNLELWIVPQPSGQRPEDLVDWVLDHYLDIVREKLSERDS